MIQNFRKGFSLVELLVVIAIIGILAAVGITAYSGYTNSAKAKASLANHAAVVALLNSELAKCSTGAGNFVWPVAGPDPCRGGPVEANIVAYFGAGATNLNLMNPYDRNTPQVTLAQTAAMGNWGGTNGAVVNILGATAVHCPAAAGATCAVATNAGENNAPTVGHVFVQLATY